MPISLNTEAYQDSLNNDQDFSGNHVSPAEYSSKCVGVVYKEQVGHMKAAGLILKWETGEGIVDDFVSLSTKAYFQITKRLKACNIILSDPQIFEFKAFIGRAARLTVGIVRKHGREEGVMFTNNTIDEIVKIEGLDQPEIDASNFVPEKDDLPF